MKTLKFLLAGAVALMAFAGCKKTEELADPTPVYDDAYYASYASISSSDSDFTSNSTGGTIHFKVSGGEVKVFVSCGTDWLVQNDNQDVFNAYISDAYYLTVSAGQNLIEEELTGTIILTTAEMHIAFASITVTQNAYGAPEITVETNEWNAPAVGKLTTTITVDSTDEWTVEGGDEWLTIEKSGTGLNLTAKENEDTEGRETKIVLTCTDGYNSDSETITVTQDGLAYITLSEKELSLPQFGDPVSVTVETNFDWEYSFNADWLTIETNEEEGTLVITYDTNSTGKSRECTVAITSGDGASNVAEAELAITQIASSLIVEANEWHAPAVGKLTTEIGVEASYEWEFECDADWLIVEKTETSLRLTAAENTETAERTTEVVLTCTDGTTSTSNTVTVTQDGKAYITVSKEELTVSSYGNSVSVTVESNYDWECVCDADWFSIEKNKSTSSFKITYNSNDTGTDRESEIAVTAGDGVENIAESTVKLTQSSDNFDALILEYTISSYYTEVVLPFTLYSITVDWGDGTTSTANDNNHASHHYSPGVYNVTINGDISGFNCKYHGYNNDLLTAVVQWGTGVYLDNKATITDYIFYGCNRLSSLPEGPCPFSNVTSLYGLFYNCSKLESVPEGFFDNCTESTSFARCFYGCSSLKKIPENLFANCANATSFGSVFYRCTALESIPDNLFANCANATSFGSAFYYCSSLKNIPENLFANCPNVTSFENIFYNCYSLESIPDNLFAGCPNVTSFGNAFFSCSSLKNIPENLFANCPNVTSFECTFSNCYSLESIPDNLFVNCPNVTSFECTFTRCSSLTTVPEDLFLGRTASKTFYRTFYSCSSIVSAPSFEGCSAATTFEDTFYDCTTLTTVPENMFSGCTAATSFKNTFYNCSSLVSGPSFKGCSSVTSFDKTFCNCTNLVSAPTFEGCSSVKSFTSMFYGFTALTTLPDKMFSGCTSATRFDSVFRNCYSLKTVPVNIFDDTSAAVNFSSAFYGCSSVNGESPYTECEINGENMKIHLYERGDYYLEMGCSTPTSYSDCFSGSTFSDMDSIPSKWGGNGN